MNTVYVVIRFFNDHTSLEGVYSSPELARKACLNVNYGFGPVVINKLLSETIPWKGFKFFSDFES